MRRVLHFIHTRGPGGAETVFLSLLKGLDPAQWESIPVLTGDGWLEEQVRALGFTPVIIPSSGSFDVKCLMRLRALVRSHGIDLIHGHLQGAAVYGALAGLISGVPTIATFHGASDLDLPGSTGALKGVVFGRVIDHAVFVSRALRRMAVDGALVAPNKAEVIWNGVDPAEFRPREGVRERRGNRDDGPPRVLVGSVGNLRAPKDYPTLLRAAALLASKDSVRFRFVVYGERTEPLYSDLLRLREELGLTDRQFAFLGFHESVAEVLRDLDVFVVASQSEGFSLAIVQAMASGVPVVSTRCGGPEDIIQHGRDGILVPRGDPSALAGEILRLAGDERLREELVRAGRRKVESQFSLAAMVMGYDRVYRKALS